MNYLLYILALVLLYSLLGYALDLLVGYAGLLTLCHAAFLGVGAYIHALIVINFHALFPLAALGALLGGAGIAFLVGLGVVKLRNDAFVLATLGVQLCLHSVFLNWTGLTNGPFGVRGIPQPSFGLFEVRSLAEVGLLFSLATIGIVLFLVRLLALPFGRSVMAIRDDEVAATTLGKDVYWFRLRIFTLSGSLAALCGSFYVSIVNYIDPSSFTLDESILILAAVVAGGAGSLRGPLTGAIIIVLLPELLRLLQLPPDIAADARQIAFGLLLVLLMRFRPHGVFGKYRFA